MRKLLQSSLIAFMVMISFQLSAQESIGIASYYSDSFQGRRTASGESYDKNKLTTAHKTYAFGTYLKVTRLDNKKTVTVKVNDRGPYISGRIVDLSRKAAEQLDIIRDGHANVKIEVVDGPPTSSGLNIEAPDPVVKQPPVAFEKPEPRIAAPEKKVSPPPTAKPTPQPAPKPTPKVVTKPAPIKDPMKASAAFAPGESIVRGKDYKDFDLYKIQLIRPAKTGYGVQVASYSSYQNAMKQVAELQDKWFKNILINIEPGSNGEPIYKTILGPFPDRKTAEGYKSQLAKRKKIQGFVVDLSMINS